MEKERWPNEAMPAARKLRLRQKSSRLKREPLKGAPIAKAIP
jgi:hypothetical protein